MRIDRVRVCHRSFQRGCEQKVHGFGNVKVFRFLASVIGRFVENAECLTLDCQIDGLKDGGDKSIFTAGMGNAGGGG